MDAAAEKKKKSSTGPTEETVLSVEHYTDRLFKFRLTRPQSFRFRSGEFVMIGLPKEDGRPLLRAYSVASPAWDEELEFYLRARGLSKEEGRRFLIRAFTREMLEQIPLKGMRREWDQMLCQP